MIRRVNLARASPEQSLGTQWITSELAAIAGAFLQTLESALSASAKPP